MQIKEECSQEGSPDNLPLQAATWTGSCCVGHSIVGLSQAGYAEEGWGGGAWLGENAMQRFCQNQLLQEVARWTKSKAGFVNLAAHYLFLQGGETPAYGEIFAAYIQDQKLGTILTPGSIENKKYHPKRKCQVWIWLPDQEAVEKWWVERNPQATPMAKVVAAVKTAVGAKKGV